MDDANLSAYTESSRSRCSSADLLLRQLKERSSPVKDDIESPVRPGRPATEYFPNFLKVSSYTPIRPHTRLDDSHGAGCGPRSIESSMSKRKKTPMRTSKIISLHWKSGDRARIPSTDTSSESRNISPVIKRTGSLVQRLQSLDNLPDSRYPGLKAKGSYGTPTPERPRPVRRPSQSSDVLPRLDSQNSSEKRIPETGKLEEDVFSAPASRQESSRRKKSATQPTCGSDHHEQPFREPSRSLSIKGLLEANVSYQANYSVSPLAQHHRQGSLDRAEALVMLERMKSIGKFHVANPDLPKVSNSTTATDQLLPSPRTKPVTTCSMYGGLASDSDDSLTVNKTAQCLRDKYLSTRECEDDSPVKSYTTPSRNQEYTSFQRVQSSRKGPNTLTPTRPGRSPHRPVVGLIATGKSETYEQDAVSELFVDTLAYLTCPQSPSHFAQSSTGNMTVFHDSHINSPTPKSNHEKEEEEEELLLDSDASSVDSGDYQSSWASERWLCMGNVSVTDMYLESFYGDDMNDQVDTGDKSRGRRTVEDGSVVPKSLRKTKKIGDWLGNV